MNISLTNMDKIMNVAEIKQNYLDAIEAEQQAKNTYVDALIDNILPLINHEQANRSGVITILDESDSIIDLPIDENLRIDILHIFRTRILYEHGWAFSQLQQRTHYLLQFRKVSHQIAEFIKNATEYISDHKFTKESFFPDASTEEYKKNVDEFWEDAIAELAYEGYKVYKLGTDSIIVNK